MQTWSYSRSQTIPLQKIPNHLRIFPSRYPTFRMYETKPLSAENWFYCIRLRALSETKVTKKFLNQGLSFEGKALQEVFSYSPHRSCWVSSGLRLRAQIHSDSSATELLCIVLLHSNTSFKIYSLSWNWNKWRFLRLLHIPFAKSPTYNKECERGSFVWEDRPWMSESFCFWKLNSRKYQNL